MNLVEMPVLAGSECQVVLVEMEAADVARLIVLLESASVDKVAVRSLWGSNSQFSR